MKPREKFNTAPHIGTLKFNIFINRMLPDGSIDPLIIDCTDLFEDNDMASKGEIHVIGFDKLNCVRKIKEKLESLSE
jgi:hypothetical protein